MPFCRNCGTAIKDGAKFCAGCGAGTGSAGTNQEAARPASAKNPTYSDGLMEMVTKADRPASTGKQSHPIIVVLIMMGIALGASLPFHYIIGYGDSGIMVFPKKGLTLENTFITEETVDDIINRYNNGSFMEKMTMSNEPIVRKLIEKKIIVRNENNDNGY